MIYARNNRVIATRLDEETAVLLHLDQQNYYSLNETGARIWELLPDHPTADALVDALGDEFDGASGDIEAAVTAFLDEMTTADIIHATAP